MELFRKEQLSGLKQELLAKVTAANGMNTLIAKVDVNSVQALKDLAYLLKTEISNLYLVLAASVEEKASLVVAISEELVKEKKLHAGNIIREIAKEVNGGGGGQSFFSTAGGSKPEGIDAALEKAKSWIK
jgi:alanyl-tRNA synthetase